MLPLLVLAGCGTQQADPPAAPQAAMVQLASEDFADDGWGERWLAAGEGMWERGDGRLRSQGQGASLLVFRQRLTPPVAIEYTGRFSRQAQPGDLSVVWSEQEDVLADPTRFPNDARRILVQAGSYDNAFCAIHQTDPIAGERRVAYHGQQLEPDRDYRFRVTLDGRRVAMAIDGVEVMSHSDPFPTTSGYISLYAYYRDKEFDDVAVWQSERPLTPSPVAEGDVLYQFGHFADAASMYARIAESSTTSPGTRQLAMYRRGLSERRLGRADLARETWSMLADPALKRTVEILRLEDLFDTGQHDLLCDRFAAYWQRDPADRQELRQQWQLAMGKLLSTAYVQIDEPQVARYLALRDRLFPDDRSSSVEAANAMQAIGRYEEVLSRFAGDRWAVSGALLGLGRVEEAARLPGLPPIHRFTLRRMRGDFEAIAGDERLRDDQRALALCKLGRAEQIVTPDERIYPAMLHRGLAAKLLAHRPLSPLAAKEALVALGRFAEAAGAGLPDIPGSGGDWRALAVLRRTSEAEAARRGELPWLRLLDAMEAGDADAVAKLRPLVVPQRNLSFNSNWFAGLVIGPWSESPDAVRRSLEQAVARLEHAFSRRAWFLARAVLGQAADDEVLAMPTASEARAWLHLAHGLRAELAGAPGSALAAYRAFADLPLYQRLLDNHAIDPQVECFVAWRLRMLER